MHQQYCVSFLCIIPWAAVVLSVNCWSRMWRVRCCAISSCLTEVCVESRRLDLLRRWQHVMFHYTALALTVWKPGAKQTGISRSLSLSLAVFLSLTRTYAHPQLHMCIQYIQASTTNTHASQALKHGANTYTYTYTQQTHFDVVQNICITAALLLWKCTDDAIPPFFAP